MTRTRHAAVLGRPIAHSLSPVLHRAAYAALGVDWDYTAIECGPAELPGVLAARGGWGGFSCTMPLKRALLDVAVEVDPLARVVGAANTLVPAEGGWRAANTDVHGIVATLRERDAAAETVTVLGAGGTAQAAVAALARLGVVRCAVAVRDPSRTVPLCETARALGIEVDVTVLAADTPALDAPLVISTLPRGAGDPLAGRAWRAGQVLLDVVYDPWPTALAAAVARAGGTVCSGALMLLHQACAQVELMTGRPAPVAGMRAALRAALPGAGV